MVDNLLIVTDLDSKLSHLYDLKLYNALEADDTISYDKPVISGRIHVKKVKYLSDKIDKEEA